MPFWYEDAERNQFPWKLANTDNGFSFSPLNSDLINKNIDVSINYTYNDKNMFQPLDSFRVIIHSPEELPYRTGHHRFQGKIDVLNCYVTTTMTKMDKDLESWTPEQRNCFMAGEKKLKFFKIYTKNNCEHECLSKASLNACGCVPFYMIREYKIVVNAKVRL